MFENVLSHVVGAGVVVAVGVVVVVGVGVVVVVGVGVVVVVGMGVVVVGINVHAVDPRTTDCVPGAQSTHAELSGTGLYSPTGHGRHDFPHTVVAKSKPSTICFCTALIASVVRSSSTTNRPAISPWKFVPIRGLVTWLLSYHACMVGLL
jgi:hypothetical protein